MLLLGGTGRTGGRVLQQLLGRGVGVRAVVRSAERLPAGVADDPRLTVAEADLLSLSDEKVGELVDGCDVVISCLGHNISAQGVFGPPRDLVTRSLERVYRATRELRSAQAARSEGSAAPVKLIVMSSVSVNRPRAWTRVAGDSRGRISGRCAASSLRRVTTSAPRTSSTTSSRPPTRTPSGWSSVPTR